MRLAMFSISFLLPTILLLPTISLADEWTPPKNPDPSTIMREARADTARGNYEVALAKQLWYHDNAVKLQPSQSGVRRSFALSYWLELGEVYPPALEKMRQIRDETENRIRDENHVRVNFEDFHDFVALNRTLRQEERTAKIFKWLDEADEQDAKRMFNVAEPALIKQKAYELCGKYIDPDHDVSRIGDSYAQGLKMAKRFGKKYQEFVKKKLLNDAAILVAILAKNNRHAEAKNVAENVRKFVSDAKLSTKLKRALDSALTGSVPTPWP